MIGTEILCFHDFFVTTVTCSLILSLDVSMTFMLAFIKTVFTNDKSLVKQTVEAPKACIIKFLRISFLVIFLLQKALVVEIGLNGNKFANYTTSFLSLNKA